MRLTLSFITAVASASVSTLVCSRGVESTIDQLRCTGPFPTAGRSLEQKIEEANAFIERDLKRVGLVGAGVSIVYDDQVVLSKGYGLRAAGDPLTKVTEHSLFQIGSVSKTMIAVAIAMLVDQGKMGWTDSVRMHLPWLSLHDKYAEEHLRIADLLSMNSGFGRDPDTNLLVGAASTEKDFVESLSGSVPQYSLRETPAYSNTNYEILGQVIEAVSGLTWHVFLRDHIWQPLGMKNTYASVFDVEPSVLNSSSNYAHLVCEGNVIGPYGLLSPFASLAPGLDRGYIAAGSTFLHLPTWRHLRASF